jgi:FMN phosphatase YigB (HAD superfamily)
MAILHQENPRRPPHRRVTFQALRRTAVTLLNANGADATIVAAQCGHGVNTSVNVYNKVGIARQADAINRLDVALHQQESLPPMTLPTTVSFDLDGTLINRDFDTILWNEELPRRLAQQHSVPLALAKEHVYAEYYKARYINPIKHWTSIDHWFAHFHLKGRETLYELRHYVKTYDDAVPALEAAAQRHTLILFTANDDHLLQIKLEATGIKKYFDHTISAPSRYGTWKKDSTAYTRLLDDLHLAPEAVLHIGNSRTEDYDAPRAAGIQALLLDRNDHTPGTITTLHAINEHLCSNHAAIGR